MEQKEEEEEKAVIVLQSIMRRSLATKHVKERQEDYAQDLSWERLPPSKHPAPEYLSPSKLSTAQLRHQRTGRAIVGEEAPGHSLAQDVASFPSNYTSLDALNKSLLSNSSTALQSEQLDLGLAHFAPPEIDADILLSVTFDKNLVENEDPYGEEENDDEDDDNKSNPSPSSKRMVLMTTIIGGKDEDEDENEDLSDSDSEEDDELYGRASDDDSNYSEEEEEEEGITHRPTFQRFETEGRGGNIGIRTLKLPGEEDATKSPPPAKPSGTTVPMLSIGEGTSWERKLPSFLKTNASNLRRSPEKRRPSPETKYEKGPTEEKKGGEKSDSDDLRSAHQQRSQQRKNLQQPEDLSTPVSGGRRLSQQQQQQQQQERPPPFITPGRDAARFRQEGTPQSPARLVIREVDPTGPTEEAARRRRLSMLAAATQAQTADVHIVGVTVPPNVPTYTSLSEETPRSVAAAYQVGLDELMARNRGPIPEGSNPDDPLWHGTPILLPNNAVLSGSPACAANTSLLGSRGSSRSHRQNATGVTARTSLRKEASKLSERHLMRMQGSLPADVVLGSYANDPIVSPVHEHRAMATYDHHQHATENIGIKLSFEDTLRSDERNRDRKATSPTIRTSAPQRPFSYPYNAQSVDLNKKSLNKKQQLRTGTTSVGIREDGRRDRRLAETMSRRNDRETAELMRISRKAKKVKRELERQYSIGPAHALVKKSNKTLAGKMLRKQLQEGNSAQYERLSKFVHPAGSTKGRIDNVKFVGRLLMVNPKTGSPTKGMSARRPAVHPGTRLTLRIEARNMGLADIHKPVQSEPNEIGVTLAVRRGAFFYFQIFYLCCWSSTGIYFVLIFILTSYIPSPSPPSLPPLSVTDTLVDFGVRFGQTSGLSIVQIKEGEVIRGPRGSGTVSTKRTKINAGMHRDPCRMLWRGNRCIVDIPLRCGKGAVVGSSNVKLDVMAGQRVAALLFQLEVMSSYRRRRK